MCSSKSSRLISKNVCKLDAPEIVHIFEKNDIILLTETWSSDLYNYEVSGFVAIKLLRTEKKLGSKRSSDDLIIFIRSKFYDKL